MPLSPSEGMRFFFTPQSVAVAGVSQDPNKLGSIIFSNLLANVEKGYLKASVYALNPARDFVLGSRCYASIDSLPETPELLIAAVPVSQTLKLVREAGTAGVKAVIMVSSGYAETGRAYLEQAIKRLPGNTASGYSDPTQSGFSTPGQGSIVSSCAPPRSSLTEAK